MKKIIILLLGIYSYSCKAQIFEELQGCWLPEKYVLAMKSNSTANMDEFLFPVEGFEISIEKTEKFLSDYEIEFEPSDGESVILTKTYKSELGTALAETESIDGRVKYKLPYFYGGLNMKYIPRETVDQYKDADVFISKNDDKLLLEIIMGGKKEKIYFVRRDGTYDFTCIEDTRKHLQTTSTSGNSDNTRAQEYKGVGSSTEELFLSGKETAIQLSYDFYKEPDELIVYDQNGKELHRTGIKATKERITETINIQGATKLVFKIESQETKSNWRFSVAAE